MAARLESAQTFREWHRRGGACRVGVSCAGHELEADLDTMQMTEAGPQHSVSGQFLSSWNNNASLVFDLRRDEIDASASSSERATQVDRRGDSDQSDDEDDDDGVPPGQLLKALQIGVDKPSSRLAATRTSGSHTQAECSPPAVVAVPAGPGVVGGDDNDRVTKDIFTPTGDRTGADAKCDHLDLSGVAAAGEATTVKSLTQINTDAETGEAKSSLPSCRDSEAPSAVLPYRRLHSSKQEAWRGHPGWKLRKGRGLISWIYTSPFGEDYESEQEALFIEKTIHASSTDMPVEDAASGATQVNNAPEAASLTGAGSQTHQNDRQETVHTAVGAIAAGDELSVVWPVDGRPYTASVRRVSADRGIELFYAQNSRWEDWTEWLAVSECALDRVTLLSSHDRKSVPEHCGTLSENQSPPSPLEHRPALPAQQVTTAFPVFNVGDAVEANYRQLGQFYGGMIVGVNDDGSFAVQYHDGDHEHRVSAADIRPMKDRRRQKTPPAELPVVPVVAVGGSTRTGTSPLNKSQKRKKKRAQQPASSNKPQQPSSSKRPTLVLRHSSNTSSIGAGCGSEPVVPSEVSAPPEVQPVYEPPTCELDWLPGADAQQSVQAAAAAGYTPWCELSDRPLLDPPQEPAVANAKYVYISTKSLGKQLSASESAGLSPEELAAAAAVRAGLSYPDSSGDTAVWMVMATRPIRQHEEILVEKYQQLESGVSNDGSGIRSASYRPAQMLSKPRRPQSSDDEDGMPTIKVKRPRSTNRSAGVQQLDAAQKWACLRPSLDRCNQHTTGTMNEDGRLPDADSRLRFAIPPPLSVTTGAAARSESGVTASGQPQHRPWGGVLDYSAYAANSNHCHTTQSRDADSSGASVVSPFRKAGGDGSRLSRAEGVAAIHHACVLGKGVYISPSVVHGAGNGLFCDLPQGLERGDAITVYDGILESVGALLYDPAQQAFFNPKLVSEHTSPDNPLWKFAESNLSPPSGGAVGYAEAHSEGAVGSSSSSSSSSSSKGFQSHWKDAGASPGGTSVIMGFGGWPVPFVPCGLGAGAMVNAVHGCKGRVGRDPEALAQRQAARAQRQQLGIVEKKRPVGSKLACSLGWGNMGRKRKRQKKKAG